MLLNIPEMPQHLILALDHHRNLLEEARRQRMGKAARTTELDRLPRWRRWRVRVGELLINTGRRLAPETTPQAVSESQAPKTVWG